MWKIASKKQQITYKGIPIRLTADLSAEILQARKEWQDILKVIKGEKPHNQDYSFQQGSHSDWENQIFADKQMLKEFSSTKPAL